MTKLKEAMKEAKATGKKQKVTEGEKDASFKVNVSIRLDSEIMSALKEEAEAMTIGYQTLINIILAQHVNGKSYEKRLAALEAKLKRA